MNENDTLVENKNFKKELEILINSLEKKFIERDLLIRLTLLAMFSKHHMFLIGQPGVGKTYFLRIITSVMKNCNLWEIQMTKETSEEKLMGKNSENDKDSLVKSSYILFDEMFKANPELLVSLLSVLNERYYTVNGKAVKVNLLSAFGASNEFPSGDMVKPFDDRLMFRLEILRIQSRENRKKFINKDFDTSKELPIHFTIDDLDFCEVNAKLVGMPAHFESIYLDLIENTVKEDISCSDRKFGYAIEILKMSAYLNNRRELNNSDLFIMEHIAWSNFDDRKRFKRILYETMFGNKSNLQRRLKEINTDISKIDSFKRSDYQNMLDYQHEFSGRHKEDFFEQAKDGLVQIIQNFTIQLDLIQDIIYEHDAVLKTQKEINENIFLIEVINKVYSQELVVEISTKYKFLEESLSECNYWKLHNRTLHSYEEKFYKDRQISS